MGRERSTTCANDVDSTQTQTSDVALQGRHLPTSHLRGRIQTTDHGPRVDLPRNDHFLCRKMVIFLTMYVSSRKRTTVDDSDDDCGVIVLEDDQPSGFGFTHKAHSFWAAHE